MAKVLPQHNNVSQTEMAIVQGGFGRDFMVLCERGVMRATLAFSCLVIPEAGDKVLINNSGKENHILAIIERPQNNDMKLSFPGNVAFEAKSGDINLTTAQQLNMSSAKKMQLTTTQLAITSIDAKVRSENFSISGDKVTSHWREVNSISSAMNLIVERLSQRIKNSFRLVDGVDQQKSQNYMQTVEKTLSIRSRDAVITARKDVKIDGERIHMG